MKKKKASGRKAKSSAHEPTAKEALDLHDGLAHLKKHIEKLWEHQEKSEERLQDIEIHLNLLTRLLTTLCVEKFGMRIGVLKRLIKRIEKEAIRDSQILHLESLYSLSPSEKKGGHNPTPPKKDDPWEEIS